jgi:hypothetical protein
MGDLPDELNRLLARLETLERRVYVLEHPAGASSALPVQEPSSSPVAQAGEQLSGSLTGGAFSVLGKAMLGIAGAYLLRAVAESSSLPKLAVAAVAIVYAIAWLVWASRVKAGNWLAATTYACTSALILAPMLWELTLRFKVLPAPVTAGVVCGFVIAASALAWKHDLAPMLWVANVTGVAIALSLSIVSHQLTPFIAVLLLMVLICEYGAGRALETGVRVLVALAADVVIWALIYIYSSPQSTRADYPLIGTATLLAPGLALFLILGVSLIYRTVLKKRRITVFETIQTMIAFLLAACSLIYFGPPASATALGMFCVALSGASYAAAFVHFDRAAEGRNYRVFATWSAALFLAGSLLCLPTLLQAPWLSAAAVAATFAGARLRRLALELHGVVFLLAAATISGLLNHIFGDLGGTHPGAPGFGIYLVSACTVLCYAATKPCQEESWRQQVLSIVFASLAIGAASALLVDGLLGLVALRVIPGAHHLAFIRTFTLCAAAIALAFSGPHWRRMELTRIGYATLALLAVKLVLEDLRNGHLEFIAASIFLFAITLIMVPRVARLGSKV